MWLQAVADSYPFGPVTHCAKNKIWVLASFFVMNSLQTDDHCQIYDPNGQIPLETESSLRLPLDSSMRIIFTGHYNGFGVEVRGIEEMSMLYHMGCFGKGSKSRSKPKPIKNHSSPSIIRKRQYLKRIYWYKKFDSINKYPETDSYFKHVEDLRKKIKKDSQHLKKNVIDLVSSEDEVCEDNQYNALGPQCDFSNKQDIVVIVPNSDSEDDDYFANMKPKCCINKIKLEEKLVLTKQEAFFLVYGLGCLQVFNENKLLTVKDCWNLFLEGDTNFISKYIVYHYYRSKGYIVKPGIKFGGDFLIYKEGPGINHSDYIVVIKHNHVDYNSWLTILGHVRMSATTVKEILIIEVIEPKTENLNLPKELNAYTVKELILSRNLPVTINDDRD
ncbi:unnamed protein product [Pieris brassicae]|uniref:tRNA-intron lyase n=1 Tax=Pieris brassicae TaxID=7116 RepID=A0A9P0TMI9_PIEBR|nr:unnamed protein product [Pieris brassicae]